MGVQFIRGADNATLTVLTALGRKGRVGSDPHLRSGARWWAQLLECPDLFPPNL
jgi:hypothetical protein